MIYDKDYDVATVRYVCYRTRLLRCQYEYC